MSPSHLLHHNVPFLLVPINLEVVLENLSAVLAGSDVLRRDQDARVKRTSVRLKYDVAVMFAHFSTDPHGILTVVGQIQAESHATTEVRSISRATDPVASAGQHMHVAHDVADSAIAVDHGVKT